MQPSLYICKGRIYPIFGITVLLLILSCGTTKTSQEQSCPLTSEQLSVIEVRATQNDALAQYALGELYLLGQCLEKNTGKAISLFRQSSESGNARSLVRLGELYASGHEGGVEIDFARAFAYFKQAADHGSKKGMYYLGQAYYRGEGIEKNNAKAIRWYVAAGRDDLARQVDKYASFIELTKAAENGNVEAQYALAIRYHTGDGVEINNRNAVYWFEHSANNGNKLAQSVLGNKYQDGTGGVPMDVEIASKWLSIAAAQGNDYALLRLCRTVPAEVSCKRVIDRNVTKNWIPAIHKWANEGQPDAQNLLGEMYRDGLGVTPSREDAIKWFQLAIEGGSTQAVCNMTPGCKRIHQELVDFLKVITFPIWGPLYLLSGL